MISRAVVKIDGMEYTVVSEDTQESMKKCADMVDKEIASVKSLNSFSSLTATVLAAMNIADKYNKAQEINDTLREQIRAYADECSKLRAENSRLKKR